MADFTGQPDAQAGPFADLQPSAQDPWSWVPPEWNPAQDQILAEYGMGSIPPAIPPTPPDPNAPKPPPPPPQKFGPGGIPITDETAAAALGQAQGNELIDPATQGAPIAPMQPGLPGIPTSTLDQIPATPPPTLDANGIDPNAIDIYPNEPPPEPPPSAAQIEAQRTTDLANLPDEAYAASKAQFEEGKRQMSAAEFAARATKNASDEQANYKAFIDSQEVARKAGEQVQIDATKLANTKVDPERWWASRSTGQKIAGYISAIVGGLVQSGRTGNGRNVGMDMIQKSIDDDVEAQKANIANQREALGVKRSAVGDMYSQSNNLFHASETHRVAAWNNVIGQLEAESQNYDPQGTTRFRIADAIRDARARRQAAIFSIMQQTQKSYLEAQKFLLDQEKLKEQTRHSKAEEGVAWKNATTAATQSDRNYDVELRKLSDKQATDLSTAEREFGIASLDAGGNPQVIMKADGKTPLQVPKEEKPKLVAQRTSVQNLHNALGALKILRDKAGGANRKTSPADQAEYNRLANQAVIDFANAKRISLADKQSQDFARDALLGADPSEYVLGGVKDRIDKALAGVDAEYNNALIGYGADPNKPVIFSSAYDKPNVETESDKQKKQTEKLDDISTSPEIYGQGMARNAQNLSIWNTVNADQVPFDEKVRQ